MGRQAYVTQMALGRSPFQPLPDTFPEGDPAPNVIDESCQEDHLNDTEAVRSNHATEIRDHVGEPAVAGSPLVRTSQYEQRYDSRGYPENVVSRALSRDSRRAMNDVLATVGVCVGVDADGQKMTINGRNRPSFDRAIIESVTIENGTGLVVDSADMMLVSLSRMITIGFRQRLQTFRFYNRVPLTSVMANEWRHVGPLTFFFAGMPAASTCTALDIIRSWAIETFSVHLLVSLYERVRPSAYRKMMLWLIEAIEEFLYGASFLLLAPLQMYATLQRLNLLPGWPWFPHPRAFVPFSASSPLQIRALPPSLTLGSAVNYLASLAVSPLCVWCLIGWAKPRVKNKLHAYIRAALPKPHYPDRYSLQAAKEDELDNGSVPGLCNDINGDKSEWESQNALEELAKDLQYIGKRFVLVYDRCTAFMRRPRKDSNEPVRSQLRPEQIETRNLPTNESTGTFSVPIPSPSSSSSSSTSIPSPSSHPTTPRPQIEISTSTASSGTIDMNLQMPHPNPSEEPLLSNSFLNSPTRSEPLNQIDDGAETNPDPCSQPVHRITALSAYPADALASHFAAHLADILFLPLESLFLRSLAVSFLSSPRANPAARTAAARLGAQVFPLGGWCGLGLRGGWRGVVDYTGKMVLVFGLEMSLSMAVWQACTRFAWMSGRRWYGWGTH